jgi:hypothetical protein
MKRGLEIPRFAICAGRAGALFDIMNSFVLGRPGSLSGQTACLLRDVGELLAQFGKVLLGAVDIDASVCP